MKTKIIIIPGSSRNDSCNAKLANAIKNKIDNDSDNAEATLVSLNDYEMPMYNGDLEEKNGVPLNAKKLAEKICEHHGVVVVSPEYNGSLTPLLKNTIDWMSRNLGDVKPYQDRVFGLASCSPGALGGIRGIYHLRGILVSIGAEMMTHQLCVGNGFNAFDQSGNLTEERNQKSLDKFYNNLKKQAELFG